MPSLEEIDFKKIKQKAQHDDDDEIVARKGEHAPVIQPLADGASSTVDSLELPTGYLDNEGVLHKTVTIQEITGAEEDILSSRKTPFHTRMNRILENCVTSIGPYEQGNLMWKTLIKDLVATDRLYLILQLRILSLGPLFSAKVQCQECETFSNQTVDLNDFKIIGLKDPMARQWSGTLPSGMSYVAKSQTGWEEAKLAKHSESKDLASLAMLARLVELDGKDKITLAMLKRMKLSDRAYLRKDFASREGEIQKTMEYECSECGAENVEEIDISTPNFFFPSEM